MEVNDLYTLHGFHFVEKSLFVSPYICHVKSKSPGFYIKKNQENYVQILLLLIRVLTY